MRRLAGLLALLPAAALASEAAPKAPPYSLPWQLRPAVPVNVVRSDTAIALLDDAAGNGGATIASMLLASYKVLPELAPFVRLGVVSNSPPTGDSGFSFVNLAFGALYSLKLGDFRLAPMLGVAVPLGMGGGNSPDATAAAADRAGILARSALDNAMFAVNDLVLFPGVDLAWIAHGFTLQVEATLLQLIRVRGDEVQPDEQKTNFTAGLHVGYFLLSALSIGAELRYQRWLSTPTAVGRDASGATRDNLTLAAGLRGHFDVAGVWIRPGLAYARGLDDPMAAADYHILQVDVPVVF